MVHVNRIPQTNFVRGEVDPKLIGRTDIRLYQQGAKRMRNVSLLPQGGFRRRPATTFEFDLAIAQAQLAEFIFASDAQYLVAFTANEVRVFDALAAPVSLLATLGSAPWGAGDLASLYWAQSGGTLVVTHPNLFPQRLLRTGPSSFSLAPWFFENHSSGFPIYQPYYKFAPETISLTPSGTTGAITLTTSAGYWVPDHVGMRVRYQKKTCTITGYTSATVVAATVNETLPAAVASLDWDEQLFSAVWGYPACAGFHDQRTIFAGHKAIPDGFWASKTDAPFNFDVGTGADDDAIWTTLGAEEINRIVGIISARHLQLMTDQGPFYVPEADNRPLTPLTVGFRKQARAGAAKIKPRIFDGATIYVQKRANVVREFLYDDTQLAYNANSLSLVSGHLLSSPINMAVLNGGATQPNEFVFVLNGDGTIAQFQGVRSEDLAGWSLWSTSGTFKAMAAVDDDLFVLVQRTINAVTKYWIERFTWPKTSVLDAAKSASNVSPQTAWAGFGHFAGHQVDVMTSGYYLGKFTVDGGGVLTIDKPVLELMAGLDYAIDAESLPVNESLGDGPVTGVPRSILTATVELYETASLTVNGQRMLLRQVTDDAEIPPPPYTGTKKFWLMGWDEAPTVKIGQDMPGPLTVLDLVMELAA